MNFYASQGDDKREMVLEAVMKHIEELAGGELPPFISVSKLEQGRLYTIRKVVKRFAGEDNAQYTGIQVFLDSCRTNLPSKYCQIFCTYCIRIMRFDITYRTFGRSSDGK